MKLQHHLAQAISGGLLLLSLCATSFGATPVEHPVGEFGFDAPAEPPSGPPLITPMVFLNGPYNDSFYGLGATTFLTMDASGKVFADSSIPGFKEKGDTSAGPTSLIRRILYVRTVNGLPVLTANAKAGGMYNDGMVDAPTEGSGKVTAPLSGSTGQAQGNMLPVTVTSSFSGKRNKAPDKDPVQFDTVDLDITQLGTVVKKNWGMNLQIEERTDPRGRKFYVADLYLFNADGTRTLFAPKTVVYSPTNGYSVSFSQGKLFDSSDIPINDSRGKQIVDKYSSIKFDKLLFKKSFNGNTVVWTPAAGGVSYKFLGQSGFGQVFHFLITVF